MHPLLTRDDLQRLAAGFLNDRTTLMGRNDRKVTHLSEAKGKLDDDVDELFTLPLAEFTAARNSLAARLKQRGRAGDAERVKALVKPPISAWAVNQLYWKHREAFDQLIATGQRFRQVQTSRAGAKALNMRGALDARREALINLSDLATELLRDAGHNPAPDTIRRITTTLEAISANASLPNAPRPGRLTQDVDPPGFETLASLIAGTGMDQHTPVTQSPKSPKDTRVSAPAEDVRQLEKTRLARIAAAKVSLQNAKRELREARVNAQRAEATRKNAQADAKESEKQRREAEQRLEKARAAAEDAAVRARSIAAEADQAAKALEEAERAVAEASNEFEILFRN